MTNKQRQIDSFDPNGPATNDNIFGLPFDFETAELVLLPIPWEVTVSYGTGTATAPKEILNASHQVDLHQKDIFEAWKFGIYYDHSDYEQILQESILLRAESEAYLTELFSKTNKHDQSDYSDSLIKINNDCELVHKNVEQRVDKILAQNKLVALLGGDHSIPLGAIRALTKYHPSFGILQIDAHMDLREAYEGFTYSHASIARNFMKLQSIEKLVQVGIRDFCEEEVNFVKRNADRITIFYDDDIQTQLFDGQSWQVICDRIIRELPDLVYISFDIDGLDPSLCPNTGTPVPGGLTFQQINYLLKKMVRAGKKIIGFDLNEVGVGDENDWDANVGARILYRLCNLMGVSQGKLSLTE